MAEIVIRGMVRVEGFTYRIVRLASRSYSVVRISDDLAVGAFQTGPLRVQPWHVESPLLREIARQATRLAKTSAVGNPVPSRAATPAPVRDVERRYPSSSPPPNAVPA